VSTSSTPAFPTPSWREDLTERAYKWAVKQGMKRLASLARQGIITSSQAGEIQGITVEEHADWLVNLIHEQADKAGVLAGWNEKRNANLIDSAWIERSAETVAEFNFKGHPVEFLESARKGGKKSKPPTRFTPDMLDGLEGLSKKEQAKRLGCSVRTIAYLRAKPAETPKKNPEPVVKVEKAHVPFKRVKLLSGPLEVEDEPKVLAPVVNLSDRRREAAEVTWPTSLDELLVGWQ